MSIRQINVVTQADMQSSVLFSDMSAVSPQRLGKAMKAIETVCVERREYEAQRERMVSGSLVVSQSPDIKYTDALINNEAFARMVVALRIDPRAYIHPDSQEHGKQADQTSNLKAYNKARQVAETIWSGSSDLETVAKVFSVCAFAFASKGHALMTREHVETFVSSRELASIREGTSDIWSAIDEVRAKYMSGGAETQSGQMVRTLVALKSATDERDGRNKNVRIDPDGLVMQALMTRFGQV